MIELIYWPTQNGRKITCSWKPSDSTALPGRALPAQIAGPAARLLSLTWMAKILACRDYHS
jgi:hypothetical protein